MKLPFNIAYRFLKDNKGQSFFLALVIGLGVSIQIFLGLLIQNLQNDLIKNTIGTSSHIILKAEDKKIINNGNEIMDKVKISNNKITTSIEVLDEPGIVSSEDKNFTVLIRGFKLDEAENIYKFKDKLIKGDLPKNKNEVAIGKLLAKDLSITTGEYIKLLTPKKEIIKVKVVSIIDFKVEALNKNYVISDLDTVRNIYGLEINDITSIESQVGNSNIFDVPEISNNIKASVGSSYVVSNWIEANESLLSGLKGQSASSYTIQVFIVLSVIVSIASILAITVMQKTKQIGILKAMGITDKKASLIFVIQGGLLGIFGALLGSAIGMLMFKAFSTFVKNSDGTVLISGNMNIKFITISAIIAVSACIISSIIPARKSLKLNPVEAIKL